MAPSSQRLEDLLVDPREELNIEIKNWLDLKDKNDRATLAKALLALANHGGGFVIVGFEERNDKTYVPAGPRPDDLSLYNQDEINRLAESFADPPFQSRVDHVLQRSSSLHFPVISVPGGHRVPIRSKKGGPEGHKLRKDGYYIRRPGPQSEQPQSSAEWDELIRRAVRNNRDDLLDLMRDVLSGRAGRETVEPTANEQLTHWVETCLARWQTVREQFPEDTSPRFPHGSYWLAYSISGDFPRPTLPGLIEMLEKAKIRYTGWPMFLLPHRPDEGPYPVDGVVEADLAADWKERTNFPLADPAHQDFWRVSPNGQAFIVRGFEEDASGSLQPGTAFDVVLPVWRVGEGLLHAEQLSRQLGVEDAEVLFRATFSGLEGRQLTSLFSNRTVFNFRVSRQKAFSNEITMQASKISDLLPELVFQLLEPLYASFNFFELKPELVQEELRKMRSGRF